MKHAVRHIVLIATIVLMCGGLCAQRNVWIEGAASNAQGKHIALYGYSDMLTLTEVLLDSTTIDSAGAFQLSFYANYPRLVFLQVEDYSQSFYIEPSRHYEVYIPTFDWSLDERTNIHLAPVALPVEFMNLPERELNLAIGRVDEVADSVIQANRLWFDAKFRPNRRYFDTLEMHVKQAVPVEGGSFLQRYRDYYLAQMRYNMRFDSRSRLFARYIEDQDVLYHDENYMRLFFALVSDAISHGTRRIPLWRMVEWVDNANLDAYLDSVGLDPLFRNERLRELAVLRALQESYYNPSYTPSAVRHMTGLLADQTKFAEHRLLAQRLLQQFDRQQGGEEVPSFALPNVEGQLSTLDQFRGKWVYLGFVRVTDPNSLAEITTMAHFYDSVCGQGNVEFVCISCDREFQKMYHFLKTSRKSSRYRWPWFHFNGNYAMLEHYGVVSYPTFVLINPQGVVVNPYAPSPASGILLHGPWSPPPSPPTQQPSFIR